MDIYDPKRAQRKNRKKKSAKINTSGHKLEANEGAATVLPSTCQWCYVNCCTYLQKQDSLDLACLVKGSWSRCFHSLFHETHFVMTRMWLILDLRWSTLLYALYNLAHHTLLHLTLCCCVLQEWNFSTQSVFCQASFRPRQLWIWKSLILSYSNYQHCVNYPPHCGEFKSCIETSNGKWSIFESSRLTFSHHRS